MKQLLNEWKTFLKEEYEVTVNPNDYENYTQYRKDFEIAAKNKTFVESFMDALMRLELRPIVKSLPEEDRKLLFKNVKESPFLPNFKLINDEVIPHIPFDSALTKAGLRNDTFAIFDYMSYYVNYFTNKEAKERFEKKIMKEPLLFAPLYYDLFKRFPEEVPTISKIYKADTSTQNKRQNIRQLNHSKVKLTLDDVQGPSILDNIRILGEIGRGAFGRVFELEDGRALKVFSSGVDFDKDIERYEKIMDQLYKGQASLEDMHIFDYGKLGESEYHFAVMPRITPLAKTDLYDENAIYHVTAQANKQVILKQKPSSFEDYKEKVIAYAANDYPSAKDRFGNSTLSFKQAYNKYNNIVDKIIQAGWRAYKEYGGTDIHIGNIGFFPQKPDQFFYFDM